ncbi:GtrA family protein [Paenibacillus sp. CF384]|uniref:GtrA family protein n=1 Tax=Paenibacillus sp. CF384 TaxID=1884382 RepID=UPI00089CB9D1|nr:GtrA family protein [Paenibacillus sp. CF384]SDX31371.1 Putative flippase GtrA (transmembrane translocase of bactoprenol-linked glucose) [Paenibacillus sp. CF384]
MKLKIMMKYGVVGVIGTALHFMLLIALVERMGLHPALASAIGFIAVLVLSYYLNRNWTFAAAAPSGLRSIVKYTVVSVSGLLLNTGIMYISVEVLHFRYTVGQLLVTVVIPLFNFVLNYYWTFRSEEKVTLAVEET